MTDLCHAFYLFLSTFLQVVTKLHLHIAKLNLTRLTRLMYEQIKAVYKPLEQITSNIRKI